MSPVSGTPTRLGVVADWRTGHTFWAGPVPSRVRVRSAVSNDYVISGGRSGFERLRVLSRVWGDTTESLLRSVGVGPGMRCLDVGCGAGDVSLLLASLVGPSGAVVDSDSDGVQLDLVRAECQRLGVTTVELVLEDVMELEVSGAYDVVYSRFVLEHLPDPLEALRRMWRAVRPGGLLVAEDGDFLADFCEPPHPGFDFWQYAYQETLRRHGGDPLSGRLLHSRFREVGIADPQLEVVQHVYLTGEGKLMPYLTIARTALKIIASGVATRAEVDVALAQLEALANDTTTAVSSPRLFQCWARKVVATP